MLLVLHPPPPPPYLLTTPPLLPAKEALLPDPPLEIAPVPLCSCLPLSLNKKLWLLYREPFLLQFSGLSRGLRFGTSFGMRHPDESSKSFYLFIDWLKNVKILLFTLNNYLLGFCIIYNIFLGVKWAIYFQNT